MDARAAFSSPALLQTLQLQPRTPPSCASSSRGPSFDHHQLPPVCRKHATRYRKLVGLQWVAEVGRSCGWAWVHRGEVAAACASPSATAAELLAALLASPSAPTNHPPHTMQEPFCLPHLILGATESKMSSADEDRLRKVNLIEVRSWWGGGEERGVVSRFWRRQQV